MEAVDLGQVFKIRIRHDNSMLSADWYLDQVEVADTDTEEVFLFLCERWLSRKREDKQIDRVFYVKVCLRVCMRAPMHACVNNVGFQSSYRTSPECIYIFSVCVCRGMRESERPPSVQLKK